MQLRSAAMGAAGGDYSGTVAVSAKLRENVEAEGNKTHELMLWFTCDLLSPLQHAKCDAAAFPFPPNPLAMGEILAARQAAGNAAAGQ